MFDCFLLHSCDMWASLFVILGTRSVLGLWELGSTPKGALGRQGSLTVTAPDGSTRLISADGKKVKTKVVKKKPEKAQEKPTEPKAKTPREKAEDLLDVMKAKISVCVAKGSR